MSQPDLFGHSHAPERTNRREIAASYHLLPMRDTVTKGCTDCRHCDWSQERCHLTRYAIDVDCGTCGWIEATA